MAFELRGTFFSWSLFIAAALICLPGHSVASSGTTQSVDLVIYGGTPSGLSAAISAVRENENIQVIVIEPTRWIGGLVTGGLSRTDKGKENTIGGLTREYFEYARKLCGPETPMWYAEPRYNLAAFEAMLKEYEERITVLTEKQLKSVKKSGNRITSITLDDGSEFTAPVYIDATYEGDLLAMAGVSYRFGRESRDEYGEPTAGYHPMPIRPHGSDVMHAGCKCVGGTGPHFIHGTPTEISALDDDGNLLAGIFRPDPNIKPGDSDELVQAYNYRICVTQREDILVPFPKPKNYDPKRYDLLLRLIETYPGVRFGRLVHLGEIANGKFDLNAQGLFSTDYPGGNIGYSDGTPEERAVIVQDHLDYVQGFLWFLGHDQRVPASLRNEVNSWGLCADEFTDNDHWPYALYVREARRMVGEYVMRQQDTWTDITKPDTVGMGSFVLDCHIVQRIVTEDGLVTDEGSFQDAPTRPYQIPYRSLLPKRAECENLLVPVCVSSSHIAWCTIRMEPVFMGLGQAAGIAAAMAISKDVDAPAVYDVNVSALQQKLRADAAVLELEGLADLVTVDKLPGIVVDDRDAEYTGYWKHSSYGTPVEGASSHDGNSGKGQKQAVFTVQLPKSGRYEVRFAYAAAPNRASAAPIVIEHLSGQASVKVDERKAPEHDDLFTSLGVWEFSADKPAVVTISNKDTDSYLSVDALQFLPLKD
ncbi:FAD-dependent oxidoreductase [Calycomorphotria hydatis]|uniref:Xanthan lyase n=1 Tax=Calycomorphotria hydatis TaxID=2528027 RepID=A0A517T4M6_9PLAN|nr:FAD-dependent oxidoreductase [Calycomorphotria hydatis]QDT63325.1 Xanthan lyase precursor [Calycomorphotria hydatis]